MNAKIEQVLEELHGPGIVLLFSDPQDTQEMNARLLSYFINKGYHGIALASSQPFDKFAKAIGEKESQNIFFIDTFTRYEPFPERSDRMSTERRTPMATLPPTSAGLRGLCLIRAARKRRKRLQPAPLTSIRHRVERGRLTAQLNSPRAPVIMENARLSTRRGTRRRRTGETRRRTQTISGGMSVPRSPKM